MAVEQFEDLRSEMFWAVYEGAFLFELPGGATDHTKEGTVKHGPWEPADCAEILLTWFERGWIELYVLEEQLFRWPPDCADLALDKVDDSVRILKEDSSRATLANPSTWTQGRAEGFVCLGPTRTAPSVDFRSIWLDVISPAD